MGAEDAAETIDKRSHKARGVPDNVRLALEHINEGNRTDVKEAAEAGARVRGVLRALGIAAAMKNGALTSSELASMITLLHEAVELAAAIETRNTSLRVMGMFTLVERYTEAQDEMMNMKIAAQKQAKGGA